MNWSLPGLILKHWGSIKKYTSAAGSWLVSFAKSLPGKITSAVAGTFDGIKDAFRSALNWIIGKWNGLSFGIPAVDTHIKGIGKIGGFNLGTPNIPMLATGAYVNGRGVLARFGEAGPESVLPDRLLRGLLEKVHDSGIARGQQAQGGHTFYVQAPQRASAGEVVRALGHAVRVAEVGGVFG